VKRLILIFTVCLCFAGQLRSEWAEKILPTLTIQEKIGQLFVVPACPNFETESLFEVIENYHIGAIIIKQGHPLEQIPFINALQTRSNLPLLCTGDAEWGLGMRMEETLSFPKNLTLGAIEDESLLYKLGKTIGHQCRLVGIHLNFAPVVDVNPIVNPIIGVRAFGDDPESVSRKGALVIRGMQDGGILACAKHFPGHGAADVDSHNDLPTIPYSYRHLEQVEFVPFKGALLEGVEAVMSGHLMVQAIDAQNPASLSYPIITELLKEKWGFQGLCITDALNMEALCKNYTTEEIAVNALMAGHDLLLYGAHRYNDVEYILRQLIPAAFSAIEKGVIEGRIPEEVINAHVLKILSIKERLGLHQNRFVPLPTDLMEQLHSEAAYALQAILYRASITVLNDSHLPDKNAEYVKLWEEGVIPKKGTVVIGVNNANQIPRLREICETHSQVIAVFFIPPYAIPDDIPEVTSIVAYEWCEAAEKAVWEVITGKKTSSFRAR